MPHIKGHTKPIAKAAAVGSRKTGHHFLIDFPTMIPPFLTCRLQGRFSSILCGGRDRERDRLWILL